MQPASLFLLLVFLLSVNVAAQENKQQLLFQGINEKDGLSNNIVNCIARDKQGYMWIGTFDGLNRYDGSHFIRFRNNRNQPSSLHQNTVHDVCVDNNDDIWCATQTSISCFRKKTQRFENFFPDTKHAGATYSDIICDAAGTIWCTGKFGLYKLSPGAKEFISYNSENPAGRQLSHNAIYKKGLAISPDQKSIWVATEKGINCLDIASDVIYNYRYNPAGLAVFDSAIHYPVTFDRAGKLVFGCEVPGEIRRYDFTTNVVSVLDILFSKKKNTASAPSFIFIDKDNRYWISTWAYASFLYDPQTKEIQEFYSDKDFPFSINGDFFWEAWQDDEGTIWLGTVNGLSFTNSDLSVYQLYEPLKNAGTGKHHTPINRYFEDDKGTWWFTCFNSNELHRYDPMVGTLKKFTLPKDRFPVRGITQFDHYLLMNSNSGFVSINMVTGAPQEIPGLAPLKKMLGVQPVYWLRKVSDSVLCLVAERSGLVQYNFVTGAVTAISRENDFLARNISKIRTCIVSSSRDLYIAFTPLTLARYRLRDNRLDSLPIAIDQKVKLPEGPAISIKEDKGGNLWMTLEEVGLIFYDVVKKEAKLWQQSDGLAFNHVFDLALSHDGKVWTAAYNKFSVFDPAQETFENFFLPVSENSYEYRSRFINLSNGNILGNINNVFIKWMPEKLVKNKTGHPVLINKLVVHDSVVWLQSGKEINLGYRDNNFTIEFGLLSGIPKNRYVLQYKLDGFDDKWIQASAANTAVYNSVPERKFVFRVRAASVDGLWFGQETTFTINVIPPFYRRAWFRVLAAFLFAGIIAWVVRIRVNSVRRIEKQKADLNKMIDGWRLKALRAQMNPHFIFNCMNSIDLYILKNDAENASRYLNKFAKLVRLILSQSNEMSVPLGKELEMLKYYIELEELRFDTPFTHTISVDEQIDVDEIEVPSMLLQPYVENAIMHGLRHKKEKGSLLVSIRRHEGSLRCIIEDDGVGRQRSLAINRARALQHDSKGSILTAERLAILNTSADKPVVTITDLVDENGTPAGTRVEINIPFEFDY
jgi:ligand-binding sensor domain-containing protein